MQHPTVRFNVIFITINCTKDFQVFENSFAKQSKLIHCNISGESNGEVSNILIISINITEIGGFRSFHE